ncbi:MAG TPA: hypothetical protein VGL72_14050 [Bryobacteraceae bacterium]|jgi:hypothetical protein
MDTVRQAIETFVASSLEPAVLEPGEPFIPLLKDHYAIEQRGQRLTLQVWDDQRNLVRRILRIEQQTRGRLTLAVEKFARREGSIDLIDRARPATRELQRKGSRLIFRERMRLFLSREFADWKLAELTSEANLEFSLSASFPRAYLRRGGLGWAAIGAGPEVPDAAAALAFGLIWLEYLRNRERKVVIEGLAIVVPAGNAAALSFRLPYLDSSAARFALFTYSEEDYAARVDPADYGNVQTTLEPCRRPAFPNSRKADLSRLNRLPGFEPVEKADGSLSLRVNGWEIARVGEAPGEARWREIEGIAAGVSEMRSEAAASPLNPLYRNQPEAWLESVVRSQLGVVDPGLRVRPLYGQAPTFAAGDRGIIDLLACDAAGRLTIIELKATADLQLPLQALDYWLRVKWHLDRGEFTAKGYFPGIELRTEPPRLLLVAPALEFHPTTESILRYLSPSIVVERIGVNAAWRKELRVMFRALGHEPPAGGTWRES